MTETRDDLIEIVYRALADAPRTRPDGKRFGSIERDRVRADAVMTALSAAGLLAAPRQSPRWTEAHARVAAQITRRDARITDATDLMVSVTDLRTILEWDAVGASLPDEPSDEVIERAAEASWNDWWRNVPDHTAWSNLTKAEKDEWRSSARAALAAVKETKTDG